MEAMSNHLLIWGAGGHGKVILDIARSMGRFDDIAFLDDNRTKAGQSFCECLLVDASENLQRCAGSLFVIAIGDNHIRARCFSRALASGLLPATLVHRSALLGTSTSIGKGTVVMPGVIVNAGAVIGDNCIINSGAIVEHDCRIEANVHISPRVVLGGGVCVGQFAHIGIGATVLPGALVGEESIVGAGAVVLREVTAHCTVVGVPAKARLHAAS
jgi:sugar O-acyltransferase (sialic acid O-acetyltransferase NeuD family)